MIQPYQQSLLYELKYLVKRNQGNKFTFSGYEINKLCIKEVNLENIIVENIIQRKFETHNYKSFLKRVGAVGIFKLIDFIRSSYLEEKYSMEMDYDFVLHYNTYTKKYACIHRDDLRYYFGAGKDTPKIFEIRVGYGDIPEEAVKEASKHFTNE